MNLIKITSMALIVGVLTLTTGCSTIADWFGWGDDDTNPSEIPISSMPGDDIKPVDTTAIDDFTVGPEGGDLPPRATGEWQRLDNTGFPVIYFAYDQDRIGTSERVKLESVANYLLQNKSLGLFIEGHCDERGSEEYNRALGERRAIAVKNYLIKLGITGDRFKTISYGEERPAVQGTNPADYAKNRRAELVPARIN